MSSIGMYLDQLKEDKKAEAKAKILIFAKERADYHQARADYWRKIMLESEPEQQSRCTQ